MANSQTATVKWRRRNSKGEYTHTPFLPMGSSTRGLVRLVTLLPPIDTPFHYTTKRVRCSLQKPLSRIQRVSTPSTGN